MEDKYIVVKVASKINVVASFSNKRDAKAYADAHNYGMTYKDHFVFEKVESKR